MINEYVFEGVTFTARLVTKETLSNIAHRQDCVTVDFQQNSTVLSVKLEEDKLLYIPFANIVCLVIELED